MYDTITNENAANIFKRSAIANCKVARNTMLEHKHLKEIAQDPETRSHHAAQEQYWRGRLSMAGHFKEIVDRIK